MPASTIATAFRSAFLVLLLIMTVPASICAAENQGEQGFKPLFDGKTVSWRNLLIKELGQ